MLILQNLQKNSKDRRYLFLWICACVTSNDVFKTIKNKNLLSFEWNKPIPAGNHTLKIQKLNEQSENTFHTK